MRYLSCPAVSLAHLNLVIESTITTVPDLKLHPLVIDGDPLYLEVDADRRQGAVELDCLILRGVPSEQPALPHGAVADHEQLEGRRLGGHLPVLLVTRWFRATSGTPAYAPPAGTNQRPRELERLRKTQLAAGRSERDESAESHIAAEQLYLPKFYCTLPTLSCSQPSSLLHNYNKYIQNKENHKLWAFDFRR